MGCKYKTSSWLLNGFPDDGRVVALGQQYNAEEKPTVILYTYVINRLAGTPDIHQTQNRNNVAHHDTW